MNYWLIYEYCFAFIFIVALLISSHNMAYNTSQLIPISLIILSVLGMIISVWFEEKERSNGIG